MTDPETIILEAAAVVWAFKNAEGVLSELAMASEDWSKRDTDILLTLWEGFSTQVNSIKRDMGIIEMVLQQRMQANHAKKLPSTTLDVDLGTALYNTDKLQTLAEHVPKDEFKKGFTPAHDETVVKHHFDKFDMRTVNSWKKYGQHVVDVIDAAEVPQTRQISIKHKKRDAK